MIVDAYLNKQFKIKAANIDFYKKNNYVKIKNILSDKIIRHFNKIISTKVEELNSQHKPLEKRNIYEKAFLQLFNLWKKNNEIKKLVFSKRIAGIACQLMKVNGVRLYHDQALFKEPGGGITPWHADQYYWPLASDKTITAWIPLQKTSLEMGPIEFSAGSHVVTKGRDLSISDKSEKQIQKTIHGSNFKHIIEPFDIGEISFHSGLVFHRAGSNTTFDMRKVMTIIYIDKDMKLKSPENDGQLNDWKTWCPGVGVGEIINSPLNPILYEQI